MNPQRLFNSATSWLLVFFCLFAGQHSIAQLAGPEGQRSTEQEQPTNVLRGPRGQIPQNTQSGVLRGPANRQRQESGIAYGPTTPQDTLWSIASDYRSDPSQSIYQVMIATKELNPTSFANDNINELIPGSVLSLPSDTFISSISLAEALEQARADDLAFAQRTGRSIGTLAPQPEPEPARENQEVSAQTANGSVTTDQSDTVSPLPPSVSDSEINDKLDSTRQEIEQRLQSMDTEQRLQFRALREQVASSISSVQRLLEENQRVYDNLDAVNQDIDELRARLETGVEPQLEQQLAIQEELLQLLQRADIEEEERRKRQEEMLDRLTSPTAIIIGSSALTLLILGLAALLILRQSRKGKEQPAEQQAEASDAVLTGESEQQMSTEASATVSSHSSDNELDTERDILADVLDDALDEELSESGEELLDEFSADIDLLVDQPSDGLTSKKQNEVDLVGGATADEPVDPIKQADGTPQGITLNQNHSVDAGVIEQIDKMILNSDEQITELTESIIEELGEIDQELQSVLDDDDDDDDDEEQDVDEAQDSADSELSEGQNEGAEASGSQIMSDEDIDALFENQSTPSVEPAATAEEKVKEDSSKDNLDVSSVSQVMSDDEIDALFENQNSLPVEPESTETMAEEPAEQPAEEPAETPAEEVAETPAEEVAEPPAEEPAETPAEEVAETPAEEVAETPAEEVAETPAEEVAETPAEEVAETPAEAVAETPAEAVAETPAEEVAETPAEEVAETPAEEVAETPAEEVAESPAEEVAETPAEEVAETPAEEVAENPAEEVAETPAEEEAEEPAEAPEKPADIAQREDIFSDLLEVDEQQDVSSSGLSESFSGEESSSDEDDARSISGAEEKDIRPSDEQSELDDSLDDFDAVLDKFTESELDDVDFEDDLQTVLSDSLLAELEADAKDAEELDRLLEEQLGGSDDDLDNEIDISALLEEPEQDEPLSLLEQDLDDIDGSYDYDDPKSAFVEDEQSSNLDLARVYIDMDDYDAAIELLSDVLELGTDPQKQEAQTLMAKLKSAE